MGLRDFLEEKLGMSGSVVDDAVEGALISKIRDPRSKLEEEAVVMSENRETRDAVQAQGHNLVKFKDAGMRLDIPNYLQKDFKALMRLAYLLKQTNPDLKRNVKFDEDCCGLFLDMQISKDASWRRVKPEEARKDIKGRAGSDGPAEVGADELRSLLSGTEDETDE